MKKTILVVDDDEGICSALRMLLRSEGFAVNVVDSPEAALDVLRERDFDLVLTDLNFSLDTTSGEEGTRLIAAIRQFDDLLPLVVMTGWGSVDVAVNTMKNGANDFIQKPWENDRLLSIINNQIALAQIQKRTQKLSAQNHLLRQEAHPQSDIVAESAAIQTVLATLRQVAKSDASVLFTGENGTGKSMYARYLHRLSARREQALIAVNMGAVTESLFESEMFGHVKGAFTDAKLLRIGRFELADGGTLFLDEIANTPLSQQAKLLRVLEESKFEKVGASKTQTVDVRILTATNCDLATAVQAGEFRKDLLYRINTIEIRIPPLRERVADIMPLTHMFLAQVAQKYGQSARRVSPQAEKILLRYQWPGNVRELYHVVERAHILSQTDAIEPTALGIDTGRMSIPSPACESAAASADAPDGDSGSDLRAIADIERDIIEQRLSYFTGEASKAAKSLGISRSALYRRLGKAKQS